MHKDSHPETRRSKFRMPHLRAVPAQPHMRFMRTTQFVRRFNLRNKLYILAEGTKLKQLISDTGLQYRYS